MRVLLLNPPGKKLYIRDGYCSSSTKANFYWPQGDLLVQSGTLAREHDLSVLDANVLHLSPGDASAAIRTLAPEAIFFVTGAVSWHEDYSFLKRVKEFSGALMVGSGDILQFDPVRMMSECTFLDAVLSDMTSDSLGKFLRGERTPLEN